MRRGFLQMFPNIQINAGGGPDKIESGQTKKPENNEGTPKQEMVSIFSKLDDVHTDNATTSNMKYDEDANTKSFVNSSIIHQGNHINGIKKGVVNLIGRKFSEIFSDFATKTDVSYQTKQVEKSQEQTEIQNLTRATAKQLNAALSEMANKADTLFQQEIQKAQTQYEKPLNAAKAEFPGGEYTENGDGGGIYKATKDGNTIEITFDNQGRETGRTTTGKNGDFKNGSTTQYLKNGTVCTTETKPKEMEFDEFGQIKMNDDFGDQHKKATRTFSEMDSSGNVTHSLTFNGKSTSSTLPNGAVYNHFSSSMDNITERTYKYNSDGTRTVTEKLGRFNSKKDVNTGFNVKGTNLDVYYDLHESTYTEKYDPETRKWHEM